MKWILIFFPAVVFAETCPQGNYQKCQTILQSTHAKAKAQVFAEKFDAVCAENKTFQCIKIVVRGNIQEEIKMQAKERGPRSALFAVKLEDDQYIFVFAQK